MIHRPDEILELKKAGYVCLNVRPLVWRVRGPLGYLEIWPHVKQFKLAGEMVGYADIKDVMAHISPFEVLPPDRLEAFNLWKDGIRQVVDLIHMRQSCRHTGVGVP